MFFLSVQKNVYLLLIIYRLLWHSVQVLGIIKIRPVFSLTLLIKKKKKELIEEVLCLG